MDDKRLPKQIFYSQLKEGNRKRGGQKKSYKDVLKQNMKKCNININNWETMQWTGISGDLSPEKEHSIAKEIGPHFASIDI